MKSFVFFRPPEKSGERGLPVFVRDGFTVAGFILGPLWLAWHRLWLPAIVALAAVVVLNAVGIRLGVEEATSWLSLLVSLWIGLEGSALRMAGLRRRGFTDGGVITADNRDDAELRYAAGEGDLVALSEAPVATPAPPIKPDRRPTVPAIGMVAFQGKR